MKKLILLSLFLSGCTQYGPEFIDCSKPKDGELALDIALEHMKLVDQIVDRTDFICTQDLPMPHVACYIARTGDKDFGNRGMIVVQDKYIGECVIHELYHLELVKTYGDTCDNHSIECGWDDIWLDSLLDEYKEANNAK